MADKAQLRLEKAQRHNKAIGETLHKKAYTAEELEMAIMRAKELTRTLVVMQRVASGSADTEE